MAEIEVKKTEADSCCQTTAAGQNVTLHGEEACGPLCMCTGGQPLTSDGKVLLASELVGEYVDDSCPQATTHFTLGFCGEDCLCGCCCLMGIPCIPLWGCRDCWNCKQTNTFHLQQGHYYTWTDKDHFAYHYMCCPACATHTRKARPAGGPTTGQTMER